MEDMIDERLPEVLECMILGCQGSRRCRSS